MNHQETVSYNYYQKVDPFTMRGFAWAAIVDKNFSLRFPYFQLYCEVKYRLTRVQEHTKTA